MRPACASVRLAHAAWQTSALAPVARPHVDALSEAVGETVHLAQLDGAQVLYVDKRNARQPIEMYSAAGKVGPAYCTGVGKAMIAFLPEEELAAVIAQQSFHRFTDHTYTTEAALRAETAGDPRPRLRLRPRGTRAGDHLHRASDPDPRRPGSGGDVGHLLDGAHDAERIGRPSAAHSCRGRGQSRRRRQGLALSGCRGITGGRGAMSGLELQQVIKRYGATQVIHGVDLSIEDGEFCVFVGPSGCGKSTLLRMVAGLEDTSEGAGISIGGRDVTRLGPGRNAAWRWCFRPTRSTRT